MAKLRKFCIIVFNNSTQIQLCKTKFPHFCARFRNFFAFLNKFEARYVYLSDLRTGGRRTSTAQRMRLAVIPDHPRPRIYLTFHPRGGGGRGGGV
jgi:hypothetical protein